VIFIRRLLITGRQHSASDKAGLVGLCVAGSKKRQAARRHRTPKAFRNKAQGWSAKADQPWEQFAEVFNRNAVV
jgi:hypothetical protein